MNPTTVSPAVLASTLLGGIGLFLLGVSLLTDGLKLAAGRALEHILAAWTRTPLHGLVTGVLLTALLQSSTAMTVAAIGFVNAGLLGFGPALWVVFGSNLGSSFTGWLVAWLGFGLKIDAFALPFVGLGMALRLSGSGGLRSAIGGTLVGFGLMFLGIDLLKQGFVGLGPQALPPLGSDATGLAVAVGLGLVMTVLLQASSATLTLVMTAVAGGMLPLVTGAAMVVGANVGTTLTGILAAIGATAGAKRLAAAHVLFNVVTAVVAVLLLHPLLGLTQVATQWLLGTRDGVTQLVVFHTAFNALGVLLMWPLSASLQRFLLARFRSTEEDQSHPHYLDRNVAAVPELALQAVCRETARLGHLALQLAADALRLAPGLQGDADAQAEAALARQLQVIDTLQHQIGDFVARLGRSVMPAQAAAELPELLRMSLYYETLARSMHHVGQQLAGLPRPETPMARGLPWAMRGAVAADAKTRRLQAVLDEALPVIAAAQAALSAADPHVASRPDALAATRERFEADYQTGKARLLQAGAADRLDLAVASDWLMLLTTVRGAVEQAHKAAALLTVLDGAGPAQRVSLHETA
jgi:phosphate:Na+ symporter